MNNELEKFKQKYEADVSVSQKRYARRRPISFTDFGRTAYNEYETHYPEPCIDITIPEHRFREMLALEAHYEQMYKVHDYTSQLVKEHNIECKIRATNPAVEKAYQKYKALLELCRN